MNKLILISVLSLVVCVGLAASQGFGGMGYGMGGDLGYGGVGGFGAGGGGGIIGQIIPLFIFIIILQTLFKGGDGDNKLFG